MNIRLFYHSVLSDWNHGNAHFLRGIATELMARGHDVRIYEPAGGWSVTQLLHDHGEAPLHRFRAAYPQLQSVAYDLAHFDLEAVLDDADLVLVHEWNAPELVRRVGEHRARGARYVLFFHDTHHRLATDRASLAVCGLHAYDGVLAYGRSLRDRYAADGLARRAWVWHEAADTRIFRPLGKRPTGDLVWVGNWGDGERAAELEEFLMEPVRRLGLNACVYGVRYPESVRAALARAGIRYAGWLPNFEVPAVFAQFQLTVHIPRRPYVEALPGIPTIRPFEALACGLPLVCSPWTDSEHLFAPGLDYRVVRDGAEMARELATLLAHPEQREALARHGLATLRARHTCAHRVDELFRIAATARAD